MERICIKMLGGERIPGVSKTFLRPRKKAKVDTEVYAAMKLAFAKETERNRRAQNRAKMCTLTARSKQQVDVRFKKLAAMKETGVPSTMSPFKTLPGAKKQSAATWILVLRYFMPYLLYGVGTETCRTPFLGLCDALCSVLDATCDLSPHDAHESATARSRCAEIKLKLVRALCAVEKYLPESELSIFVHEIVHVADFLYRWNNVRNYWCFVTERFVGYVKGFVKNRHLALENLVFPCS